MRGDQLKAIGICTAAGGPYRPWGRGAGGGGAEILVSIADTVSDVFCM